MNFKRTLSIILILSVFLMPSFSLAATCNKEGYTVFFLNGVFNFSEEDVAGNSVKLQELYTGSLQNKIKGEEIKFDHIYNPSHLGGTGDILAAGVQKSAESLGLYLNDVDLINIQNQVAGKLNTEKFIIVSHSQGNFYANAFVSSSGLANSPSFKIYPVASPASYNAASFAGRHITSANDKIIVSLVRDTLKQKILDPNVSLEGGEATGHAFKETYLEKAGDKITGDISQTLSSLEVSDKDVSDNCVNPISKDIPHSVLSSFLGVTDKIFSFSSKTVTTSASVAYAAAKFSYNVISYSVKNTFSLANSFGNSVLSSIATSSQMAYKGASYVAKETLHLLNLGLGVADGGPAAAFLANTPTSAKKNTSIGSTSQEKPPKESNTAPTKKEETPLRKEGIPPAGEQSVSTEAGIQESITGTTTPTEVLPTQASSSVPATTSTPPYLGSGGVAVSPAEVSPRIQKRCDGDESLTKQRGEGDISLILKETSTCNTYIFPHGITLLFGESLKNDGTVTLLFGEEASFSLSGNNAISFEGEAGKEVEFLPLENTLFAGGFIFTPRTGSSTVSLSYTKISSFGKRLYWYGGLAPLLEIDDTVKLSLENVTISSPYKTEQPHLLLAGESSITNSSFETMLTVRGSSTLERVSIKNTSKGIALPLKETALSLSKISFENIILPLEVHGSHSPLSLEDSVFINTPKEISLLLNYSSPEEEVFSYVWDNPGFTYRFENLYVPDKSSFLFKNAALVTSGSLVIEGGTVSLASSTFLSVGDRNYYREELSLKNGGAFSALNSEVSSRVVASGSSTILLSNSLFSDRGTSGITLNESSLTAENSLIGVLIMYLTGSSFISRGSTISSLEPIYLNKTASLGTPSSVFAEHSSFVFQEEGAAHSYDIFINGGCFSSDGFEDTLTVSLAIISCSMETTSKHLYKDFGTIENDATVRALPGTILKISPAGSVFVSSGSLKLLGTAEKPVAIIPESYCVNFIIEQGASLYAEHSQLPPCSSYGSNYYIVEDIDGSSLLIRGTAFLKNTQMHGLVSLFSGNLSYENVSHTNAKFFIQGGDVSIQNSLFGDMEGLGHTSLANSSCGLSSLVFENNIVTRDSLGCLFIPLPVAREEASSTPESLSTPPTENFSETPLEETSSSTQDGEEVMQPSQSFPQE